MKVTTISKALSTTLGLLLGEKSKTLDCQIDIFSF